MSQVDKFSATIDILFLHADLMTFSSIVDNNIISDCCALFGDMQSFDLLLNLQQCFHWLILV
jgi:hypothetical protein